MRADWGTYTGLLCVGLGMAYWASLPAKDADADKVAVWDLAPNSISEITYKTADSNTVLLREGDSAKRFWVTFDRKANEKDPKSKAENDRFLANEEVGDVLNAFHPFNAQRSLGKLKDDQIAEFGLKDAPETLTVKSGDKSLELRLGKKSYGSRNQFAMDPKDEKVYLVDGKVMQTLGAAKSRLYERRFTDVNWDEVTRVEITAGTKKKAMQHTKKEDNTGAKWSDEGKDAPEKPSYGSWVDKIAKLRTLNFATPDEAAALKDKSPFLAISLEKNGAVVDILEFRKVDLPQSSLPVGADPTAKALDRTGYFLMSKFLGTPVRLASSRMEPIEKDMPSILE